MLGKAAGSDDGGGAEDVIVVVVQVCKPRVLLDVWQASRRGGTRDSVDNRSEDTERSCRGSAPGSSITLRGHLRGRG